MLLLTELDRVIRERSPETTIRYRGWHIAAQTVKNRLWIRCQHPLDNYARYGIPVLEEGIADAIERVKFWIDRAIALEQENAYSCDSDF